MASREVVVGSTVGLHARPASLFVQAVSATGAAVELTFGDKTVNAASILSVLSLGVPYEATVTLSSDNAEALESLSALLATDLE